MYRIGRLSSQCPIVLEYVSKSMYNNIGERKTPMRLIVWVFIVDKVSYKIPFDLSCITLGLNFRSPPQLKSIKAIVLYI